MKQPRQQSSLHESKAWASLDCLLTSLPITPLTRSSILMRSSGVLPMTDTRRLSPQTTSSSGYHSDLSSTNESPQSIHEIPPPILDQSSSSQISKETIDNKSLPNKNLLRISSFIRKQYERAKSKLISSKSLPTPVKTCTKGTSITPLSHITEKTYTKSSLYKQSSFLEPVHSVYVQPLYDNQVKMTPKTYPSKHECNSHCLISHSKLNNNQVNSHSYRRLATMANYDNAAAGYLAINNTRRQHYYSIKPSSCQSYYPYRYIHNNYDCNRSSYAPLSDFISTTNSAFKPVVQKQYHQHPPCPISEQVSILPSDDPCDLEVAQYFRQTPQWSNPNYFDIYTKEITARRQNYTETLC